MRLFSLKLLLLLLFTVIGASAMAATEYEEKSFGYQSIKPSAYQVFKNRANGEAFIEGYKNLGEASGSSWSKAGRKTEVEVYVYEVFEASRPSEKLHSVKISVKITDKARNTYTFDTVIFDSSEIDKLSAAAQRAATFQGSGSAFKSNLTYTAFQNGFLIGAVKDEEDKKVRMFVGHTRSQFSEGEMDSEDFLKLLDEAKKTIDMVARKR